MPMPPHSARLFEQIVEGLTILAPYLDQFSVDPVPKTEDFNSRPARSTQVAFNVILNGIDCDDPHPEELQRLKDLGWRVDLPYITLIL